MKGLLKDFRPIFRDRMLDLLWRQWSTLGVAGHVAPWQGTPIDPEALLLISCTVARYDARLFDAIMEWMSINGRYINVQRLNRIMVDERFTGGGVFRALAATVKDSVSAAKWARSATPSDGDRAPEPLFFLEDGRPMLVVGREDPVFAEHGYLRDRAEPRGSAAPFPAQPTANLTLKLRALFGVSARCEIIAFLLLNRRGSPRSIARDIYYFPGTVSKALSEMRDSGYVVSRLEGRRRYHTLVPDLWRELLLDGTPPAWVIWPRMFSALETIWGFLTAERPDSESALAEASALRRVLLGSVVEKLDTSTADFLVGDLAAHPGADLIPFFVERVTTLLDGLAGE